MKHPSATAGAGEARERERELRARAEARGQGHVFRFWDSLGAEERAALLAQVETIDFDLLDRLAREQLRPIPAATPAILPADIARAPATAGERREEERARREGESLLRARKVAAFLVAGGQGTRLGLEGPKGAFAIGPVTARSLFQLHAEKILASGHRHGAPVPWYIMTSEANHEATEAFFRERGFFGLREADVRFFTQEMLPALDRDGKLILETRSRIFTNPNGHGGSMKALQDSGALADMKRRAIELISYFQVDNPLVKVCDAVFLGRHALAGADMSNKVVRKSGPEEKVGVIGRIDGQLGVIEYSDLPADEARATLPDGSLKHWAGSIAIHILSVSFVERLNRGGFQLPYHRAEKAIPYVNDAGETEKPTTKNGIKFETFVFDALAHARASVSMEVRREEEFSPVKNAEGEDSPATARRDLTALYLRWLEAAGARIERGPRGDFAGHVELSPLTALEAEDLAGKVRPGTVVRPGFVA